MLCKKGVGELLLNATTPHVRDGQMRARGGWAMGSEEGGRGREGKKKGEAGRTDPCGGQAGRDAHPSTQQKQDVPPVPHPPFTSLNFALERRASELATRDRRRQH